MGKLVLYLADGTTLDIRLARERITIGRRADNDVCLPYPAVSGEHAAVVTILSDSFLEDLGSTNGTLVNDKPVAKHFLRDRDLIDIGRQKLIYVADESVELEPAPQGLGVRADVPPEPSVAAPEPGLVAELRELDAVPSGSSMSDIERFVAAELGTARTDDVAAPPPPAVSAPPGAPATPPPMVSVLRVLTGPNAGRELVLDRDEATVGRVGLQVATVRRSNGAFRLVPLEGAVPPRVNGTPVPADGQPVKPGDSFEIAGVRLEMDQRPVAGDS
jgi:hypothetical protein